MSKKEKLVFDKSVHNGNVNMSVRDFHYGTYAYIEVLWKQAKKDFPTLKKEDVKLLSPTAEFGTYWGIMFQVPEGAEIPSSYERH